MSLPVERKLLRTHRRARAQGMRGFTLIEFMVAASILTAGMLGLALLLSIGIQSNAFGSNANSALAMAQSKIEDLRNLSSTHASRTNGGSLASNVSGYNDSSGIFIRRWELSAGPGGAQICRVRVLLARTQNTTRKVVELATVIR